MDSVLQRIHSVNTDAILNKPIDKNAILDKYDDDCKKMGHLDRVTTTKKGEPTHPTTSYPSIYHLVRDCSMKPDDNHYYRVQDLSLENVIVVVLKSVDGYLSDTCTKKLHCLNGLFNEMTTDVC
jgi:hypothetical protein